MTLFGLKHSKETKSVSGGRVLIHLVATVVATTVPGVTKGLGGLF